MERTFGGQDRTKDDESVYIHCG